jgi:mycofactocin system glycosyltransferase
MRRREYELEPDVRRGDAGRLLAGGTPPQLLRFSKRGARALDRILAGDPLDGEAEKLARRLAERGTIAPLPPDPAPIAMLTSVVPVRNGGPRLGDLVAALRQRGEVIVVDDRSTDGSAARAADAGATVLPNAGAPGPAGARNTGLRAAGTELVALVDADCRVEAGWSDGLAALLAANSRLAIAGPRVRSSSDGSILGSYESRHSPLDHGSLPSLVGPGRRIGYLPAAALVVRRTAILDLGGFDESMRFGEDVDLVWRVGAAGGLVRYVPTVEVEHEPRHSVSALAAQRRGYGSSAAALETRHPGAVSPLRASATAYMSWAAALRGPRPAVAFLTLAGWRASRRSSHPASRRALAMIALRGQGTASLRLARALRREWIPLTAAALALGGLPRRVALFAVVVDSLATLAADGPVALDPRAFTLSLIDDGAYAAGLWEGAIREAVPGALRPRIGPLPLSRRG